MTFDETTRAALYDAMIVPAWLAANGATLLFAWRLACRLFPEDGLAARWRHSLVLAMAWIIGIGTFLGMLGVLVWPLLLGTVAVLATVGTWLSHRARRNSTACSDSVVQQAPSLQWCWPCLWLLLVAYWLGHVVENGMRRLPIDADSLWYHLPLVVQWLQDKSLYPTRLGQWSMPGNNELLTLWIVAPFSSDFLFALTNLPAAILLALSAYELARLTGLSNSFAHLTALAVTATKPVLRQMVNAENDLAVASLFLTAICYGIRHIRRDDSRGASDASVVAASNWRRCIHVSPDTILAAISLGILTGIKYYALGYAAVAFAVIALSARLATRWAEWTRTLVTLSAGMLLLGGFWYARNAIVTGTPFFPLGVSAQVDPEVNVYPDIWQSTFLGNGSDRLIPLMTVAVMRMAGPVHLAAFVTVPLVAGIQLATGVAHYFRKRCPREAAVLLLLAFAVLGSALVLAVTPYAVEDNPGTLNQLRLMYCPVRYGLCFLSTAVVGLVWSLDRLARWFATTGWGQVVRCIPLVLLCGATVFQVIGTSERTGDTDPFAAVSAGMTLLIVGAAIGLAWTHIPGRMRTVVRAATVSLVLGGVSCAVSAISQRWQQDFARHFNTRLGVSLFQHLDKSAPQTTRVCVLDYRVYPFSGARRQFTVYHPLRVTSRDSLLDYLTTGGISIVAVRIVKHPDSASSDRFEYVHQWVTETPERFELLFHGYRVSIYQFVAAPHTRRPDCRRLRESSRISGVSRVAEREYEGSRGD